jgi:hypothetical protein
MFFNPYSPYFYNPYYSPFYVPVVIYRQPVPVYGYGPFGPVFLGYR